MVEVKAIDPQTFFSKVATPSIEASDNTTNALKTAVSETSFSTKTIPSKLTLSSPNNVFVQVGAFSERSNADKLRQRLLTLFKQPTQIKTSIANSKPTYKVQIGPLLDNNIGQDIVQKLSQLGLKGMIKII